MIANCHRHFVMITAVFVAVGCVSARSVIQPGVELNQFRFVAFDQVGKSEDNLVAELSRLFLAEGVQPVSEARVGVMDRSELSSLLICRISLDQNSNRAVVDLTCSDARAGVIYSGSGMYGLGWDSGGDLRGAAARAFEGFGERYTGFTPPPPSGPARPQLEPRETKDYSWNTPLLRPDEVIRLTVDDFNHSIHEDLITRLSQAVISISGETSAGTAFLISRNGLALTNHHVIAGQLRLTATSSTGTRWPVRVLRSDSIGDVALLEVACDSSCITVPLASEMPQVGTDVYVYGSPLGLQNSLSRGIVSAVRLYRGVTLIQTDASVNPGNSGGPMVARDNGEVVALVSAKVVGEGVEGLGFAITIADALRVIGVFR